MIYQSDPTHEERGWTRVRPPTRNLRRFRSARRLRIRQAKLEVAPEAFLPVKIRHRVLRGLITDYVAIAERVGLNAENVATAYRHRRENGWDVLTRTAFVAEVGAFRGQD